jgi:hypothetical protein
MDPGDEMNLNDPSVTTLKDGTILLTAFVVPSFYEDKKAQWGDRRLHWA